ncbi:UNVERIFIED_CONTAM: Gag-Pol polyprotein [Sesamum radiatum]|uniref:Gag-Pol polyprotein n=1 Tax=Sesamum radiatum TaxID=300843 RepID=A0AAW2TK68_SESRA
MRPGGSSLWEILVQKIILNAGAKVPKPRRSLGSNERNTRRKLWKPRWGEESSYQNFEEWIFLAYDAAGQHANVGQKKFVLVVVDHFTKWIEAEPLAQITEEVVVKFLWRNLLCRFSIPQKITTDNGTQFQWKKMREWCAKWNIKQVFTSVGNAKANGQTEVSNRIILQNMKTRLGQHKRGWLEELPGVLWAYRTTARTSSEETPFSLVYGSEALIPAKITEPTIRVIRYEEDHNREGRCLDLDLIDEK